MNQDIESMFNGTVQETADARDAVSDVISENSKLNGDFESSGNIEIRGTVMGNVVIDGMLSCTVLMSLAMSKPRWCI